MLLIRHAHAGSRQDWTGDERLRPLTPKGLRQALGLVAVLRPFEPERVIASPFLRCVQTVQMLAYEHGLKVETADELLEGSGLVAQTFVRSFIGQTVALCTHGDVILDVLVSLADEERVELGPAPRQAKGSTWVLEDAAGVFLRASYVPPAT